MNPYNILFRKEVDEENDSVEYTGTAHNGRTFIIRDLGNRFFLEELRPIHTGAFVKDGKAGIHGKTSKALAELARTAKPSEFYARLPDGVRAEDLVCMGGGLGLGSITYPTLKAAKAAACQAVEQDTWYQYHDPEVARKQQSEHEASGEAAREKIRYWQDQLVSLKQEPKDVPALFRGLGSMFGQINQDTRNALLAFCNAPGPEAWEELAHKVLLGGIKTAWQVWSKHDPSAPRSKPHGDAWQTWPEPERFLVYLKAERVAMIERAEAKLAEGRNELEGIIGRGDKDGPGGLSIC